MVAHNAIPISSSTQKIANELPFRNAAVRLRCQRSGNAPPPAIRTPGFCKRLIHPPCHIYYRSSSMKAIGIRCWPDSHHALPGCPSEGAERHGTSLRAPSHSQRPIAREASQRTHRAPCSPRETSICRRKTAGFSPSSCYAQVLLRPALRPRPTHWTRCQAAHARTVCLQQPTIDRLQPPHGYASG